MKIAPKLATALVLALLALPTVSTTVVRADGGGEFCNLDENRDLDECKREKPKLQTRFFSE
jgi:hypothetical protein